MNSLAARLRPVLTWVYGKPGLFPAVVDLAAWMTGLVAGALVDRSLNMGFGLGALALMVFLAVVFHGGFGYLLGLYRRRWRVSSFDEVAMLGLVWFVTAALVVAVAVITAQAGSNLRVSAVLTGTLLVMVLYGLGRAVWRWSWEQNHRVAPDSCQPTIVFGAGEMGTHIVRSMQRDSRREYFPVALLDDHLAMRNRRIDGVRVRGGRYDLAEAAADTGATVLMVAVDNPPAQLMKELTTSAAKLGLKVLVLPNMSELVGFLTLDDVLPPSVDDLLGREPVEIDLAAVSDYIRGKRVLVTGAGGSIGSELSRQVQEFAPSELYLLDRDESALHALQLAMEGQALLDTDMLVVADIRDRSRMFELFQALRPEVVFHTAALKHLTLLERHPAEGIKTNTVGTKNLLDAAVATDVDRFVNISTDKAADPTSVLGATKQAAERLTAAVAGGTGRPYVSVRFGNVLGSRGSVLPTFLGQIEQGMPITVTHPDVTRYFMTIPEAVRLVVQAGAIGDPGEVMILDMGAPVKIVDLARQLINSLSADTEIVFTGLRKGEKLHEVLISEEEVGVSKHHPRITHTVGHTGNPAEALAAIGFEAVAEAQRYLDEAERGPASPGLAGGSERR